jgi:hypothetical protein
MRIDRGDGSFCVDALLLGELLGLPPPDVQALMRSNAITSVCERGEGADAGRYRLTFFYNGRRARLDIDESGHILKRSVLSRPLAPANPVSGV